MPSTIRLYRVLKAPPERVYRAFLDPGAMCKWLPPHGFTRSRASWVALPRRPLRVLLRTQSGRTGVDDTLACAKLRGAR